MKNIPRSLLGFKIIAALALASAGISGLQAQLFYTGTNGTLWSSTTSWAGGVVPTGGESVSIRNTATGTNTFDLATPFTSGTLGVASRTLDASSTAVNTTINLNGGVRNFTSLVVAESASATAVSGSLTLSNGTFNLTNNLQIGIRTATGATTGTGTVIGTSSLTFTATNLANFEVGTAGTGLTSGAVAAGTLDLTNVASGILSVAASGTVKVGSTLGVTTSTGRGTVILGNNWVSTTIGVDAANRAVMEIGRKNNNSTSAGSFTQTGGTFNAFLSTLDVGHTVVGSNGATVTGTLTLAGTSPTIDTTVLNIGNALGSVGVVTLGNNATLTVSGGNVNVGNGSSVAGTSQLTFGTGGNFAVSGSGNIIIGRGNVNATTTTANVTLGSSTTTLGTSGSNRVAALSIGTRIGNTTGLSTGTLTQTGGSFTGYFTSLNVGQVTSGTSGGLNTGTVDLTGVGTLLIDVAGTTNIGRGRVAAGSVTTGLGVFRSGATNIGDPLGDATGASLNLNKTAFRSGITTSTGVMLVDVLGQVNATVGTSNLGVNQGGITIINTGSTALAINSFTNVNNEGVQFTFENFNTSLWEVGNAGNFEAIYYGILWQGIDRIATINSLISTNRLAADTSAISGSPAAQVFLQGGDTYYGFYLNSIPEPNTAVLLALSLTAVMVLRRRRSNS